MDQMFEISDEAAEEYLLTTIHMYLEPEVYLEELAKTAEHDLLLMQYFIDGDIAAMAEMMSEEQSDSRDKEISAMLSELLEKDGQNTYFAVIDAAHYCRDNGILENLSEMGYEVTPFFE